MTLARALWSDDSGQDLVEYVILLLIMAAVVGVAIAAFRDEISSLFNTATSGVQAQSGG